MTLPTPTPTPTPEPEPTPTPEPTPMLRPPLGPFPADGTSPGGSLGTSPGAPAAVTLPAAAGAPSPSALTAPFDGLRLPAADAPDPPLPTPLTCEVPHFAPVRSGGGRCRRPWAARGRLIAAGLAMAAAALAGGVSYGAVRTAPAAGCPAAALSGGR